MIKISSQIAQIALLALVITLCSCDTAKEKVSPTKTSPKKELSFTETSFEAVAFSWEYPPYNFTSFIQDTILTEKGAGQAAWYYSYIGDVEQLLLTSDIKRSESSMSQEEITSFKNFKRQDAKPYIIQEADKHKVTIINEAHHMPQHRVFTTYLLQDLYDIGYRHLGMETFVNATFSDSMMMADKYPRLTNGAYTKEPQLGNAVREAIRIGFQVFSYESRGHKESKGREINQATNISNYMKDHPNEKYLIHCGYDHVLEGEIGSVWGKAMAGRLTEISGVDPLTISQTYYSERSEKMYENPYYQLTDVEVPSIYVLEDSIFGESRPNTWCDLSIFHPRTKKQDRAQWLLIGEREVAEVNFANADITLPCMVFAYVEGEEVGKAVPFDVQETDGDKSVHLVLEKGKYNIILQDINGKAMQTKFEVD